MDPHKNIWMNIFLVIGLGIMPFLLFMSASITETTVFKQIQSKTDTRGVSIETDMLFWFNYYILYTITFRKDLL